MERAGGSWPERRPATRVEVTTRWPASGTGLVARVGHARVRAPSEGRGGARGGPIIAGRRDSLGAEDPEEDVAARQEEAAWQARQQWGLVARVGRGRGAGGVRQGGVRSAWGVGGMRCRRIIGGANVAQVGLGDHPSHDPETLVEDFALRRRELFLVRR